VRNELKVVGFSLFLGLQCQACFFAFPVDTKATVRVDATILGTWRCLGLDEAPDAKPANFTVNRLDDFRYSISFQEDADDPEQYEAFASVVKGKTILNVKVLDAKADVKPWTLVTYSFLRRPDIVHLYMVDEKKLSGAGSSSLTLRRAVENNIQHGLFEDWCVCVRTKS
jgi:hypothetical protein